MKDEKTIEGFRLEYENLRLQCDRTTDVVKNEIEKIFLNEGISLGFPIQKRVKKWESILEKLNSGRFNIKKSVTELQDLSGIRIILLFKSDVEKVCTLLKANFEEIKTYNPIDKLQNDQFGYASVHVIAKIPKEWAKVPSFNGLDQIQFEIQVRTLSQHMWAEASNIFQYKQEQNVPKELLRSIGRASALLETVDLEFERLLIQRENYRSELHVTSKESKTLILNVDLLSATLENMLPAENKYEVEDFASLLEDLEFFKINTVEELTKLITQYQKQAIAEDKEMVQERLLNHSKLKISLKDKLRLGKGVFFTYTGLVRTMLKISNDEIWQKWLKRHTAQKKRK
jgi:putative GTP pyrophosphokinase